MLAWLQIIKFNRYPTYRYFRPRLNIERWGIKICLNDILLQTKESMGLTTVYSD